jgi:putative ABC transport system permease protein
VAVVSERFAARLWPARPDPVGERLKLGAPNAKATAAQPWITVVGVAGDMEMSVLERTPRPIVYVPFAQHPERGVDLGIRVTRDPMSIAPGARAAIRAVDPEEPVSDVLTLERQRRNEAIALTYAATLMGVLGAIALALSLVGVYGLTAYVVAGQTHEIGVRMALGAGRGSVLALILRRGLKSSAAGMAAGVALAFLLARALAAVIWGVNPNDPTAFGTTVLALAIAVFVATLVPARRATKIQPMQALRDE